MLFQGSAYYGGPRRRGAFGDNGLIEYPNEQTANQSWNPAHNGADKMPVCDRSKKNRRIFQAEREIVRDVYGKKLAKHNAERNKKCYNKNYFDIF